MREVRISDTLSGKTRALEPRDPPRVGIYTCGPTVYSRVHVGNARPFVIPILLPPAPSPPRLRAAAGHQRHRHQRQDLRRGARGGRPVRPRLAREMTRAYVEDTDRLDLGRPDAEPLASETIAEIIELIEALIESGHAYESGGDVYYRVRSFPDYGKLSNRDPAEMDQGEEAGTASLKEDPLDFALWKAHKTDEDTSWPSPWGEGRPGWHIECSAMGEKLLGTRLRHPRRRRRSRLPPSRERDRPDRGRPRGAARAAVDAQRDDPGGRREDVEVGRQHLPAVRSTRPLRPRCSRRLPDLRATTTSRSSSRIER